jgi:hypothetical protein
VRVESPDNVDDFVVRFDDGSRRYFQVKLALQRRGETWQTLWLAMCRQLRNVPSPDDRLVLVLGEPSTIASDLKGLTTRTDGAEVDEWLGRLTAQQRTTATSIAQAISADITEVLHICRRLDVYVWPGMELERDYIPLWMPDANVAAVQLFETLAGIVWNGAETRSRFDGAALRDRLSAELGITIAAPLSWGLERYRASVIALADIEVPGTGFRPAADANFLWPRCLRYDRDRRPDFDDDLPGWRDLSASEEVNLRDFPGPDLNAVVVVAGPGFGKSTLVKAIARRTALAGLVPAILPVTKFSDTELPIAEYLERVVNAEFDVRIDWRAAATTGALVLFVDGLDEVSSVRRTLVLERLKVYCAANPSVRWMLTVRDAVALAPPEGATVIELAPLRDADVSQYVAFYRPDEPGLAEALLARISSRTDLAHLVRIPIFLALMLVMRLEGADLRRSDLLETYIETLFRPSAFKSTENETLDVTSLRNVAERAAFKALEADSVGVTNRIFAICVKDIAPPASAEEVREALVRRGVLRSSGLTRLSFPFPIVQEYLASAELLEQSTGNLIQRLRMIFKRPWAQAVQFTLERHPNPEPLLTEILEGEDDVFHTGLRLLGRCLANGMSTTLSQRDEIGRRLAAIWGASSWHTNKLINGIIVDAFARPLHCAISFRLGERRLIHEGADTIVALNQNSELTMSVLHQLLDGDIEHLLNIGELQGEVDKIGTDAFAMYVERCRRGAGVEGDVDAISCLIGHMRMGSIAADAAYAAATDETLPLRVRLAAWSKSGRQLNSVIEDLVIECIKNKGYHPNASAAKALSSSTVDVQTVQRLLRSPELPASNVESVLDYLIFDWRNTNRNDRIEELLGVEGFTGPLRNRVLVYSINDGNLQALDSLADQMEELSVELVCATLMMLGNVLERSRVERCVAAVARRMWTAGDRVSIASAFTLGLTNRMKMLGLRTGILEPIPFHPGRNAPHGLLKTWLLRDDYNPIERLRIVLDAVRQGVLNARDELRSAVDTALAAGVGEDDSDAALAARAIELLHANGIQLGLDELERLVRNASYNLATSAVALISARGTQSEANTLMRLYEEVNSTMLRLVILGHLEPLAGRLGLRVTRSGNRLSAVVL